MKSHSNSNHVVDEEETEIQCEVTINYQPAVNRIDKYILWIWCDKADNFLFVVGLLKFLPFVLIQTEKYMNFVKKKQKKQNNIYIY